MSEGRRPTRQRSVAGVPHEVFDDVTPPPIDLNELERNEWRLARLEKKHSEVRGLFHGIDKRMATAETSREEMHRRVANVEVVQTETGKEVRLIKEGQIGLASVADQIFNEVKKMSSAKAEDEKFQRTEGGAWKRTFPALIFSGVAAVVALTSLILNKC